MAIQAVLFDVGGPLNTERTHERLWDARIRAALAAAGSAVDAAAYAAAERWAVQVFAPNAYQAIVWRLVGGDAALAQRVYAAVLDDAHGQPPPFELRPGIAAVLERLQHAGLLLGLAANQPLATLAALDAAGIGRYFAHREVAGSHGFRKPDVRLFLRACEALGVAPAECIMVGDRIDCDVVPARVLGMSTILFRSGRHAAQQPRSWDELPDAEVTDVPELARAIDALRLRR